MNKTFNTEWHPEATHVFDFSNEASYDGDKLHWLRDDEAAHIKQVDISDKWELNKKTLKNENRT